MGKIAEHHCLEEQDHGQIFCGLDSGRTRRCAGAHLHFYALNERPRLRQRIRNASPSLVGEE